jgi:hypothetical protein
MRIFKTLAFATMMAFAFASCTKDVKEPVQEEVSQDVIGQIKALGFNTDNVQKVSEGYLVEGDIILTEENLRERGNSQEMIYANEEHYRTTNLVSTAYTTIRVALSSSSSTHTAAFTAALDEAIRRYNALPLRFKFARVTSGQNITINAYYQVSNTLGSAGFPTSGGAPYNQVQMNTYHYSTSTTTTNVNYIATIMAHEMGHCIGFRHTDYMDRSYSCGGAFYNEGSAGVGAIHISGSPTGPSAGSWMLACIGSGVNRPFTTADQSALNTLY